MPNGKRSVKYYPHNKVIFSLASAGNFRFPIPRVVIDFGLSGDESWPCVFSLEPFVSEASPTLRPQFA